jgi:hypothetical protein
VAPEIKQFCARRSQSPLAKAATRERSSERLARQLVDDNDRVQSTTTILSG